jgi:hypothetical protein
MLPCCRTIAITVSVRDSLETTVLVRELQVVMSGSFFCQTSSRTAEFVRSSDSIRGGTAFDFVRCLWQCSFHSWRTSAALSTYEGPVERCDELDA